MRTRPNRTTYGHTSGYLTGLGCPRSSIAVSQWPVSSLLVVALALLGVVVVLLLSTAGTHNSPIDVEGWHRRLRVLRDTAQPDAEHPTDEKLVADNSERNVRVLHPPEPGGSSGARSGRDWAGGPGRAPSGT